MQAELQHTAFYQFVRLDDPDAVAEHLRALCRGLTGSILVADEGINGMLAATPERLADFEAALRGDPLLHGAFADIVFKRSPCRTPPFARLKVHRKAEIVPMGVAGIDARQTGINVSPLEWRELMSAEDVVLLDNRNAFEFRLGHFRGAINPDVRHFRDFPAYVEAHVATWRAQGKRVAMYCTGGIRCEKTSAWMRAFDIPVYQLEGGILNFFQQLPDADRDFLGECFVFDNRIALDTRLQETGTTLEQVYSAEPDGEWRLNRARRLAQSVAPKNDSGQE